jgi:hypothetical protein
MPNTATKAAPELYFCPECKQHLVDYARSCQGCGLDLFQNDPRPKNVLEKSINRKEQSIFFYVSPLKLVVMSIATLGFYEIFWFYKNWTYVQEHSNRRVLPLGRAIFRGFTFYSLVLEINKAGEQMGISGKVQPILGLAYFVLLASGRLPGLLAAISFLTPFALLPAQNYINSMNANSPTPINSKFSAINWVAIVIGVLLNILAIVGLAMPDEPARH